MSCILNIRYLLYRFRNKLTIDYRLEAEKFTGRALSRVFFEGKTGQADNVVERSTQLFEQTHKDLQCEEEMVYIKVRNSQGGQKALTASTAITACSDYLWNRHS